MRDLTRMVEEIATDHAALTAGLDYHADVAGRVAGRRLLPGLGREPMVGLHQLRQPRIEDRLDGVAVRSLTPPAG
jgi:hypothetical protein